MSFKKYASEEYVKEQIALNLGSEDGASHSHDDLYYTESEIDTLLNGKADATHNHDDKYYTEAEIDEMFANVSGSGASVQADLAVNDENDDAYVKNRTHWVDDDGTVHKIDPMYLPDEISGGGGADLSNYATKSYVDDTIAAAITEAFANIAIAEEASF